MRDNVILIHIDALRPDHVGFIGYKRPTTPRIDRFREEATWFKNAYSPAPTTRFALSMLFTGWDIERIPQARGHASNFTLLPGATTLAERLSAPRVRHASATRSSYVIQHIHDLGQGFRIWETPWQVNDWEKAYQNSAEQTTNAALKYLSTVPADGSKPYLLFLHYSATTTRTSSTRSWDYGDSDVDKYDSALNYEDDQLGRLFDALDARARQGQDGHLPLLGPRRALRRARLSPARLHALPAGHPRPAPREGPRLDVSRDRHADAPHRHHADDRRAHRAAAGQGEPSRGI